ncbi:MAG: hypothetical protein JJ864_03510 [Rhizobiaceae bacterium]|nr:hypothetical protein [Rhizobiaceae bacterium]
MMDWKEATEQERAALMRVVTLLLALAGLAECAASRSPAMRGFVLWVLRRAEAVARDFVAGGHNAPSMPVEPAGNRPADALRLALSLRRLARQLERQIKRQARLMLGGAGSAGTQVRQPVPAMHDVAHVLSMLMGLVWPIPAPDTS